MKRARASEDAPVQQPRQELPSELRRLERSGGHFTAGASGAASSIAALRGPSGAADSALFGHERKAPGMLEVVVTGKGLAH